MDFMHIIFPLLAVFCGLIMLCGKPAGAQTTLGGNLQNYNAFQTTGDHLLIAGRNRLRMEANHSLSRGSIHINSDLYHRYSEREHDLELLLREAWIDVYFENSDLRAGVQTVSFGRSASSFVTDILTPLDLRESLTQDFSDLRMGFVAANYIRYFGQNYLQLIASPAFQPHRLPEADSRWFPEPDLPEFVPLNYTGQEAREGLRNLHSAARFAWRSRSNLDLDLMLYYWSHPAPAYALELAIEPDLASSAFNLVESYQPSPMAGYSLAWRPGGGSWEITTETLFVQRRLFTYLPVPVSQLEAAMDDPQLAIQLLPEFITENDGFLAEKPWIHTMLGARYETRGWTFAAQGFLEYILNYDDELLPQEFFPAITTFAGRSFFRERLDTMALGHYNIYAEDFWIQWQGGFEWSDDIEIAGGVNLFGGPDITPFYGHFTFNRYRPNSFLFLKLTAYF